VAATANGAGYRYGVSDQAFHVPAVMHALDPSLMVRDAVLIDAQARLMLVDNIFAAIMSATGIPLDILFFDDGHYPVEDLAQILRIAP